MWVLGIPFLVAILLFAAGIVVAGRDLASQWSVFEPQQRRQIITLFAAAAAFVGGLANFALFWTIGVAIGGAALTGHIENGRHFVASHGQLTEVAPWVWWYSYYHWQTVWVTHPLAALAAGVLISPGESPENEPVDSSQRAHWAG